MSVIPIDLGQKSVSRAAKGWRFWHRLAERLDALIAYPIKNAVSEQELRRVDDDIKRCRELMSKNPQLKADAKLSRMRPARARTSSTDIHSLRRDGDRTMAQARHANLALLRQRATRPRHARAGSRSLCAIVKK